MARIILDYAVLKGELEKLKENGKTIVFTNGCFDILHVGHVRCLKGAGALGDILVVAVNSDDSARRLKGKGRPLIPGEERVEIIAAIEGVDFVTLFTEDTVKSLLTYLKPHIHAKGTDYTAETLPERDIVLGYGGKIAIVGDPKRHDATTIVKAIRDTE